jgi:hypothetical protein
MRLLRLKERADDALRLSFILKKGVAADLAGFCEHPPSFEKILGHDFIGPLNRHFA